MNNLQNCFKDYFNSMLLVTECLKNTEANLPGLSRPFHNLTDQLRLCSRAQPTDLFLKSFPDVKERLLGKIQSFLEEEVVSIVKLQENIKIHVDKLKGQLKNIEKAYEKLEDTQEIEFNALIPSYSKLLELAIDSWKIVHVLWLGIKISIESIDYFDESSIKQVSKAFAQHNKMQAHFEYVSEFTKYLRTS